MSDKYVVSQEFMNKLEEWKNNYRLNLNAYVTLTDLDELPMEIDDWRWGSNNRLIAILRWVNGEDVFEVEKPKLWVVRSNEPDGDGDYGYVQRNSLFNIGFTDIIPSLTLATKFNSKEEAEHWVGPYQEVIEVEE